MGQRTGVIFSDSQSSRAIFHLDRVAVADGSKEGTGVTPTHVESIEG